MRKYFSFIGTTVMTATLAGQAYGFTEPQHTKELGHGSEFSVGIKVVRPDTIATSTKAFNSLIESTGGVVSSAAADKKSGAVRILSGKMLSGATMERTATADDFIQTALTWIDQNQNVVGISSQDVRLNKNALLIDKDVQFVKFDVYRDGLKIEDASLDFRFKQGQLVQIANMTFAEASSDRREGRGGLEKVAAGMLLANDASHLGAQYRVRQTKQGYELVRVERFDVQTASDRFVVSVEAANAKVFEVRPSKFHLEGEASGHIHQRYYGDALTTVPYVDLNLSHNGGVVTTDENGQFSGAPANARPKLDGFQGPRVKVVLKSGTKVVREGQNILDRWSVVYQKADQTPAAEDKNVAQAMVYHHTNDIIRTAKRYISSPWFERQLTANTNLSQTCNAHWDGTTINFYSAGGGCANTGLISDVVFHEWGHGLDHNTGGIQDGGFSEGYGDIISLLKTRSPILGVGFRTNGDPVRDLAPDRIYPRDAGGGVHSEGLIIGSTFYDLYTSLRDTYGDDRAIDILSNYAFKMIFTAARYTDVYNALLVIDDNDADLSNGTPNYCVLNKTFAAHGLATADNACELAAVDEFQVIDTNGNNNGIIEPGESISVWMSARNAAQNDLSDLSGTLSIIGTNGITVTQPSINWPIIPSRDIRRSSTAAEFEVGSDVACGTSFEMKVNLAAGDRTAVSTQQFYVGRLAGLPVSGAAAGLPKPIADNSTTATPLEIFGDQWSADAKILKAHLKFDITHTYIGDLTVSLIGPDGSKVEIFRGSGSNDDVHFDEDISDKLAGLVGGGTWTFQVVDSAAQDTGTLDNAVLTLTPAYFECR